MANAEWRESANTPGQYELSTPGGRPTDRVLFPTAISTVEVGGNLQIDGKTNIASIAQSGPSPYADVTAPIYGAVDSNNTADATTNVTGINAAITAVNALGGGDVLLPWTKTGIYYVNARITLKSGVRLRGSHKVVTIRYTGSAATDVIGGATLSDVTIQDLTVDGNRAAATGNHCINLTSQTRLLIQNVRAINATFDGIDATGTDILITDNQVESVGRHGISVSASGTGLTRCKILHNTVLDAALNTTAGNGIVLVVGTGTGSDVLVDSNIVDFPTGSTHTGAGIYAGQTITNLVITNNDVRRAGNGRAGFTGAGIQVVELANGCIVNNNRVTNSVYVGISIGSNGAGPTLNVIGGTIHGNTIDSCGASGIETEGQALSIIGNQCSNNTGHGIYLGGQNDGSNNLVAGSGRGIVAFNQCWNNGNFGIVNVSAPFSIHGFNICWNNSQGNTGVYSGLGSQGNVNNADIQNVAFVGNISLDDQGGSATQSYGIDTHSAPTNQGKLDGSYFWWNIASGNINGALLLNAAQATPDQIVGNIEVNPEGVAVPLVYSGTISLDPTLGNLFTTTTVNATGNATINAASAGRPSQEITIIITNDATSGKTITYGTNFKPSATQVGVTSKTSTIRFKSDGTNWWETARVTGTL